MKKKGIVFGGLMFGISLLMGCENAISDNMIAIEQYKGLEVARLVDEDDYVAVSEFESAIWEALVDNCTFKEYPQEELEKKIEELQLGYSYVANGQKDAAQLIEEIHGMSVEELAEQELKKYYAIQLIAEKENLELTDKEYKKELTERAELNGMSSEEYESLFGRDKQYQMFLEERVLEFLKEHLK